MVCDLFVKLETYKSVSESLEACGSLSIDDRLKAPTELALSVYPFLFFLSFASAPPPLFIILAVGVWDIWTNNPGFFQLYFIYLLYARYKV